MVRIVSSVFFFVIQLLVFRISKINELQLFASESSIVPAVLEITNRRINICVHLVKNCYFDIKDTHFIYLPIAFDGFIILQKATAQLNVPSDSDKCAARLSEPHRRPNWAKWNTSLVYISLDPLAVRAACWALSRWHMTNGRLLASFELRCDSERVDLLGFLINIDKFWECFWLFMTHVCTYLYAGFDTYATMLIKTVLYLHCEPIISVINH